MNLGGAERQPGSREDASQPYGDSTIQRILADSRSLDLRTAGRTEIAAYFDSAWTLYEWLFSGLKNSSLEQLARHQPNPFRNSLGFYFGHTAAFYAKKMKSAGLISARVSPWDDSMSSGVWPESAADIADFQEWPSFDGLRNYRAAVAEKVRTVIDKSDFSIPIIPDAPLWALLMGIEHEFLHFQTTVPLIRQVPLHLVTPPAHWDVSSAPTAIAETPRPTGEWVKFAGGTTCFGRDPNDTSFYGWDNEYGTVTASVSPFAVKRYAVTNHEFLQFVEAGGYQHQAYWTSAGADVWFRTQRPECPAAWVNKCVGQYRYRCVFEEIDMPWRWPVEVNKHEAVAYANWAQARLINEAEFSYLHQQEYPNARQNGTQDFNRNISLRHFSPIPVDRSVAEASNTQLDLFGNVARWVDGSFEALNKKQFMPNRHYPDFSKPWFRSDYSLILGAGFTSLGHAAHIGLMRDFMQNHLDQVAGITLVAQ